MEKLPLTFLDLAGYVLPGSFASMAVMFMLQGHVPVPSLWTTPYFAVAAAAGYVAGHIMAAFQTQTLGWVCDCLERLGSPATHEDDCSVFRGSRLLYGRLNWFSLRVLGVRPLSKIHSAQLSAMNDEQLNLDSSLDAVWKDKHDREHERRLRAFTLLCGNATLASLSFLPLALAQRSRGLPTLVVIATAILCFLTYCRHRIYRLRFIYVAAALRALKPTP